MVTRNLIRHQIYNSQSTLTTSRFVRLLVFCLVAGSFPLLALLISLFVFPPKGRVPPWPGWAAVHKHFYDIPKVPFSSQTPNQRQTFVAEVWFHIISGSLAFGVFTGTDEVREDLRNYWSILTRKIHGLYHPNANPPPLPSFDTGVDA